MRHKEKFSQYQLCSLHELIAGTKGKLVSKLPDSAKEQSIESETSNIAITGISIDSRTLKVGEAYFAIRGPLHDGHSFAADAFRKGAQIAVVAERQLAELPYGYSYIAVQNVDKALWNLAEATRKQTKATIIAVTGSVGKTSTKEMLKLVFSTYGKVHASEKSFNNHWGVPLTLSRLPSDTDFCIIEIGTDHTGEINKLIQLVQPNIAIVTSVGLAHIGNFGSISSIAKEKAEIFSKFSPINSRSGIAVINTDSSEASTLIKAAKAVNADVLTFGENQKAMFYPLHVYSKGLNGCEVVAKTPGHTFSYQIGAPGRHLVINSLAVFAALMSINLDPARAIDSFKQIQQMEGRGMLTSLRLSDNYAKQEKYTEKALLLDESYNANPTSMLASLTLLRELGNNGGRRIAVLGDMADLGEQSIKLHIALGDDIKQCMVDKLFLIGPFMKHLWDTLPSSIRSGYAHNTEDIKPMLIESIKAGDIILVKGSNYMQMCSIVDALKRQFPSDNI